MVVTRFMDPLLSEQDISNFRKDFSASKQPLGAVPKEEIASGILYLCGATSATGTSLVVDGGLGIEWTSAHRLKSECTSTIRDRNILSGNLKQASTSYNYRLICKIFQVSYYVRIIAQNALPDAGQVACRRDSDVEVVKVLSIAIRELVQRRKCLLGIGSDLHMSKLLQMDAENKCLKVDSRSNFGHAVAHSWPLIGVPRYQDAS